MIIVFVAEVGQPADIRECYKLSKATMTESKIN
jgi:hypothetical protein